jgi:hypothetical protein
VLRVRGSHQTAGTYTCTATSAAGSTAQSTVLYVHSQSAASVCLAGYCLHAGRCSVAVLVPGEHQPVCLCSQGYTGPRCQFKHRSTTVPGSVVMVVVVLAVVALTVASTCWLTQRLKQLELHMPPHPSSPARPSLAPRPPALPPAPPSSPPAILPAHISSSQSSGLSNGSVKVKHKCSFTYGSNSTGKCTFGNFLSSTRKAAQHCI